MNQPTPVSAPSATCLSAQNDHGKPITPFRWLLLLGLPPALAAHLLAPEVFRFDEA